jgi:hypothetical protein
MCRLKLDNCIALGWVHIYRDTPHKTLVEGAMPGVVVKPPRGWGGSDHQGQWCKETLVNRSHHLG